MELRHNKILIIAYYWPPVGGGGVMRWLKFTKYLPDHGWAPIIYTPEGGESAVNDPSLQKDIPAIVEEVRRPIWEPYDLYKKLTGRKKGVKIYSGFLTEDKNPKLSQKISIWIRSNLFIPDARMFWIRPSVKFLKKYLKDNPVDLIVSTGPPHSMHMIALGIKKHFPNLPWVADFRDPWTNIDYIDDLMLTRWAENKNKRMEREVLATADRVVTVSWSWGRELEALGGRPVDVITNGFDTENFKITSGQLSTTFSITHIGSMNKDRNPPHLWSVLKEIASENKAFKKDLEIVLVGQTDITIIRDIERFGLTKNLEQINHMPHQQAMERLSQSQLLLLPLNNTPNISGVMPGKLYEYMGAKRPILCIGSTTGDTSRVINETGTGVVIGFDEREKLKTAILRFYDAYQKGQLSVNSSGIGKYSRQSLASKMSDLFKKTIKPSS